MDFVTLENQNNLIKNVILKPLKVNRDPRGFLVETLKTDWTDVFGKELSFAQNYYSITESGVARDEDRFHVHPTQMDRFVFPRGDAVVVLFDPREDSPTRGILNLVKMGESNGDEGQFLLLIPNKVMHGFCNVGETQAMILNYPSKLYDSTEEGRMPFAESGAFFSDGTPFSWDVVRQVFR
ncbi:MAG: dTDP-4-dehydrorhamnose 3,5-epimerase family protein [Patescibacteria group bacterium]|nr:dTDP-4-dehydrorhamnose 3,5-epimerase family protein [Patescibacteria group bacterium]